MKLTKKLLAKLSFLLALLSSVIGSCNNRLSQSVANSHQDTGQSARNEYLSQPLITKIYTADAAAHVFKNKIYIYLSHDTNTNKSGNNGDHYDMVDYHILSMKTANSPVTDHGVGLSILQIPWAKRQLWAPDAAFSNGIYYLFFPAKDQQDIFRIGLATSKSPVGPFIPEKEPITGSYSIDPAVFKDKDGSYYMYFGGIRGGQLQNWEHNQYNPNASIRPGEEFAILPRVAKLDPGMKKFAGPVREVVLLDSNGNRFREKDNDRRFFEGAWMHIYNGKYYFSYSTGDTHKICYAIGSSPYGPFTYAGILLNPVKGWTTHHSIIQKGKKWYLFYHDVQLSGKNHLRNIKMTQVYYNKDGTLQTITPYRKS